MLPLFSPYSEHHQNSGDIESHGLRKCWVIKGIPAWHTVGAQQRSAGNKRLGSRSDSHSPPLEDVGRGIWAGEDGDGRSWGHKSKGGDRGVQRGCCGGRGLMSLGKGLGPASASPTSPCLSTLGFPMIPRYLINPGNISPPLLWKEGGNLTPLLKSLPGYPTAPLISRKASDSSSQGLTPHCSPRPRFQSRDRGKLSNFYFEAKIINGHQSFKTTH